MLKIENFPPFFNQPVLCAVKTRYFNQSEHALYRNFITATYTVNLALQLKSHPTHTKVEKGFETR